MANIFIKTNEATAARRRVYFHCVDATDGMTPETGEASGQPQISVDGASWTDTGIGTLTAIGNGRYYADITQATVNVADAVICTRYKSANTAECVGDTVIVDARLDAIVALADAEDVADAFLDRLLSAGTDSGGRTVRNALRMMLNKVTISGGTMTVYKEDDSTSAWTAAVTTDAGADPITVIDPS